MGDFKFSRNQQLAILALVALALIGFAVGKMRSGRADMLSEGGISVTDRESGGVEVDASGEMPRYSRDGDMPTVMVHVAGCVKNSGVYSLPAGSRVVDAVKAAGGQTSEADMDAINLAARLKDGEKVIVPSSQPVAPPPANVQFSLPTSGSYQSGTAQPSQTPRAGYAVPQAGSTMVNINTAGPSDLDRLPGVGPSTAQKIMEYRTRVGRFSSVEQLLEVKGIGPKKLEQMRPFVTL